MQLSRLTKLFLNREVSVDARVPIGYLVGVALNLFMSLFRGVATLGLKSGSSRFFYRSAAVKLRCRNKISISKGVRLGRGVLIDGLGERGVVLRDAVKIGDFSVVACSGSLQNLGSHIEFAKNVGIGEFSRIGGSGGVVIGQNTIIGQYFSAHPENHNFLNKDVLIRDQGTTRSEIIVGQNCWIGAKVTLLAGSRIGDSCVVAAGSVVNGVFPEYSIIGGVPARLIKAY